MVDLDIKDNDEDSKRKRKKFEDFKKLYAHQIELWISTHHQNDIPPIWWNEKESRFEWLERARRRRMMKNR